MDVMGGLLHGGGRVHTLPPHVQVARQMGAFNKRGGMGLTCNRLTFMHRGQAPSYRLIPHIVHT